MQLDENKTVQFLLASLHIELLDLWRIVKNRQEKTQDFLLTLQLYMHTRISRIQFQIQLKNPETLFERIYLLHLCPISEILYDIKYFCKAEGMFHLSLLFARKA